MASPVFIPLISSDWKAISGSTTKSTSSMAEIWGSELYQDQMSSELAER